MTFCVTGNRPQKFPFDYFSGASIQMTAYFACLKRVARECLAKGYDTFITGMARGVDLDFAIEIIKLKNTYRQYAGVKIIAAVPHRSQAERYDRASKKKYDFVMENAERAIVFSEEYTPDCFFVRNRFMVDESDLVVAFWNEKNEGGTAYTVNYARKQGKETNVISLYKMI